METDLDKVASYEYVLNRIKVAGPRMILQVSFGCSSKDFARLELTLSIPAHHLAHERLVPEFNQCRLQIVLLWLIINLCTLSHSPPTRTNAHDLLVDPERAWAQAYTPSSLSRIPTTSSAPEVKAPISTQHPLPCMIGNSGRNEQGELATKLQMNRSSLRDKWLKLKTSGK